MRGRKKRSRLVARNGPQIVAPSEAITEKKQIAHVARRLHQLQGNLREKGKVSYPNFLQGLCAFIAEDASVQPDPVKSMEELHQLTVTIYNIVQDQLVKDAAENLQ